MSVRASRLRILVTGLLAQYPLGGLSWHYLQYALGLKRLGHDVYYLEDTGAWPYNPVEGGLGRDCRYNVEHLGRLLARFGLADRWMYRFAWKNEWYGLGQRARREVVRSADLLLNVSGTVDRPADYREVRRLVYIDTDPVFTQLRLALGQPAWVERIAAHDVHFSFGEGVASTMPPSGHRWRSTRQPVVLDEWNPRAPHGASFTTVMNWTSYDSVRFANRTYGQKNAEFRRFYDLPTRVHPTPLELALAAGKKQRPPRALLAARGWRLVDPAVVCADLDGYRRYIEGSRAEWSVAKNAYVRGRSGWFSERSACYLAAGRPVVVQETGFSAHLPVGEGLFAFDTLDEAAAAIGEVEAHYARHARAARALAEAHFDSDKVLGRLIDGACAALPATRDAAPPAPRAPSAAPGPRAS